jgi:hypothetical protein
MIRKFGGQPCQDREKIRGLYLKNFFSLPGKIPAAPTEPLDHDVAKALQKLHQKQDLYARLPKIDCGACGSPTCMTFAEDVVKGLASADDCVFITMKQFEALSANLLEKVRAHNQKVRDITETGSP